MGFKNLYAYNLAMLAKQGWRLISNPQSLIAQVYKAWYFPYSSFWDVELGDSPSFSWRSILTGRPVLKAGVQWKIGNGTQVNIWSDCWIPIVPQYQLHKPANTSWTMVEELIDGDTREWNQTLVMALFPPYIAEKNLCIPISRRECQDKLIWSLEKKGFFSVKSAYWIAREQVLQNCLSSTSTGDPYKELWKRLWKAKVPSKVLICNWRACNNLLPTRERLLTKGYTGDMTCLLCHHHSEDVSHVFCKCPNAQQLLSQAPFNLQHTFLPRINFKERMLERALELKPEVFERLLMLNWALWKNRNNALWNGQVQTAQDLVFGSFAWLDEFQQARGLEPSAKQLVRHKWKPAEEGRLKLNVDAAFIPNQHHGGVGGVIRDAAGQFKAAFMRPIAHAASPKQCELLAIREGMDLLFSLQIHDVVIESDCLEAVNEVSSPQYELLANGGLIDDIKQSWRRLQGVKIQHTPRSCNAVAHRLAALGFEAEQGFVWFEQAPKDIRDVLLHDCNQLS